MFFARSAQNDTCKNNCVYLSTCFNLGTGGWILMKFSMDTIPLEATPGSYNLISYNQRYQYGGRMDFKVGITLALRNNSSNMIHGDIFENIQFLFR